MSDRQRSQLWASPKNVMSFKKTAFSYLEYNSCLFFFIIKVVLEINTHETEDLTLSSLWSNYHVEVKKIYNEIFSAKMNMVIRTTHQSCFDLKPHYKALWFLIFSTAACFGAYSSVKTCLCFFNTHRVYL